MRSLTPLLYGLHASFRQDGHALVEPEEFAEAGGLFHVEGE